VEIIAYWNYVKLKREKEREREKEKERKERKEEREVRDHEGRLSCICWGE